MSHHIPLATILALASTWSGLETAEAQVPGQNFGVNGAVQSRSYSRYQGGQRSGPAARPAFSPYLNLLRSGNSTLLNYYGLVRPELEFRAADQQFDRRFGDITGDVQAFERDMAGSRLTSTGHAATFMGDLQGGPGTISQSQQDRFPKAPGAPGSRLGTTGHPAYFGNQGTWFQGQSGRQ